MQPLVQSAIDFANQGNKPKAIELIRQALTTNPNDVDAWLVLAAVMDDPERKRQCLDRVLRLDPTNMLAREELLQMDRAHMGAAAPPAQPVVEPVTPAKIQPRSSPTPSREVTSETPLAARRIEFREEPEPSNPFAYAEQTKIPDYPATPKTNSGSVSKPKAEKPQVFKYSLFTRIITYIFLALFGCMTLVAFQDVTAALLPCGLFVIMLPVIWIVSAEVEVSEKGIRTSRVFGLTSAQANWDAIASIKANSMHQNLQLTTRKGNSLKVTSQVKGYPAIIEILRTKRPDLFGAAPVAKVNTYSSGHENSPSMRSAAPSFTGKRTFRKNVFRQYGILLVVIPLCFFAVWTAFTSVENRMGALIATGFCGIMIVIPFFQVSSVKVEADKLTIETLFQEKVFSVREIKEIKMDSVRGRYGRITNFVNIIPAQGGNYPLQGFSDGDEIIYGILFNWWNANQNR